MAEVVVYSGMAVAVADVRAHKRAELGRGLNARGFRGALRIHKAPAERRVVIVGGDAAYGSAVDWELSLAPALGNRLEQGWRSKHRRGELISVMNLSEPDAGASSYAGTLRRYAYLAPDVVCIYDGYAATDGVSVESREKSLVFRTTGYLPILGLHGRPQLSVPSAGVDPVLQDVNAQVDAAHDPSCERLSAAYCTAMAETVSSALAQGRSVVVATPPYVSARHRRQQESLAAALARQFGSNPRFQYIAVGASAELRNRSVSADGINLTAGGYEAVADRLVDAIFEAVHESTDAR